MNFKVKKCFPSKYNDVIKLEAAVTPINGILMASGYLNSTSQLLYRKKKCLHILPVIHLDLNLSLLCYGGTSV